MISHRSQGLLKAYVELIQDKVASQAKESVVHVFLYRKLLIRNSTLRSPKSPETPFDKGNP